MRSHALVVDNDPIQLAFFERELLDLGYTVTSSTSFGAAVASYLDSHQPALILLDLNLGPGPSGIDIAVHVRTKNRLVKIILVTTFIDIWDESHSHDPSMFDAVLNKAQFRNSEQFRRLLLETLSGREKRKPNGKGDPQFSGNALLVWRLLALGQGNQEIADKMGVTVKAIEKTLSKLASSLGVKAAEGNVRVQLVRKYVERNGQLPD